MTNYIDKRNVTDMYKGLSVEAIKADLNDRRIPIEIAIENLERDFNMGTIVRTANAFNVRKVHVIGRRQWNKRGAMMTDKYLDVVYHTSVDQFVGAINGKFVIAVDNIEGSTELYDAEMPDSDVVLVFGSEANGLSQEMIEKSHQVVAIEQFGSTRSLNVGVAAGIVMYEWVRRSILSVR